MKTKRYQDREEKKSTEPIGVIVARFQVPMLHVGHQHTISYALKRHQTVLIILGKSYSLTDRNPLSFEMRRDMVHNLYSPERVRVIGSDSLPSSYGERSRRIDELIEKEFPNRKAIIYGARDSFIHTYEGTFETHEVNTITNGSATQIRRSIKPVNSVDFRSGIIYALTNQKPLSHPAVDVAVVSVQASQILLVGKDDEEGKLRLPGVFFKPELDDSYESAGARCVAKEIPSISFGPLRIVKSCLIEDWRFKKTSEKVVTLVMTTQYGSGNPEPGDGVDTVQWVHFDDLLDAVIPDHKKQAEIILKHYQIAS